MTVAVSSFVAMGVAMALLFGAGRGFDTAAVIILALIVAFGVLGIAVARKMGRGAIEPGRCARCGGLISPNSPYCKHCGALAG